MKLEPDGVGGERPALVPQHLPWDGDLRHLEGNAAAAATTSASVRRAIVMRSQAIDGRSASKC